MTGVALNFCVISPIVGTIKDTWHQFGSTRNRFNPAGHPESRPDAFGKLTSSLARVLLPACIAVGVFSFSNYLAIVVFFRVENFV